MSSVNENLLALLDQANQIIFGKEQPIRLAVCCLLAKGHLLIEDVPGVGKTTLASTLARLLGLDYQRIQFTSDLLPADIVGGAIFRGDQQMFEFRPGPIFRQMILADEINRATPRTQSALLEAMEERQVTVDGMTYPLPEPFYVIATQNPHHYSGTFSLPESQLDRFLMRIELGYPDPQAERTLLMSPARQSVLHDQPALFSVAELLQLQEAVAAVYVSAPLLDYVLAIIGYTRHSGEYPNGLSPRAGLALLQAARAWALLDGRDAVIPEDVQAVLPAVAGHRIGGGASHSGLIVAGVLKNVPLY